MPVELNPLLLGAALGLGAGLSPGPLTTLVIATTLRDGLRGGLQIALAPLLTDVPIIALCIAMLWLLADVAMLSRVIGGLGGCYLLWLAWHRRGEQAGN